MRAPEPMRGRRLVAASSTLDALDLSPGTHALRLAPDELLVLGTPEQVEAVRWIFAAYLEPGASLATVARELNRRGVPPPRGKPWTRYTVRDIITNPRYQGDAVWNVLHKGKFNRVKGGAVTLAGDTPKGP